MHVKPDWYSFSVLIGHEEGRGLALTASLVRDALIDIHEDLPEWLGMFGEAEGLKGRKPYSHQYHFTSSHAVVMMHPNLSHALIEISGRACDALLDQNTLFSIIEHTQSRCTRLDIAVDIETDTRPKAFAEMRDNARFKSYSEVESDSGSTYYVGSRTSDRYARVYRYNPPHERSHLLRCEMVLRGDQARAVIPEMVVGGVEIVAAQLGNSFGWRHPDWQPDTLTSTKAASYRPERREGKTLFWLADTIAPLLARLHREGVIDAREWFEEHITPNIEGEIDF